MQMVAKLKVSFYVLSEDKAQDLLGFICQLTQTALNKSSHALLILGDDESLLNALDDALWQDDPVSFIPHDRLSASYDTQNENSNTKMLAPVLLGGQVPSTFDGIVINTTARSVDEHIASTSDAKVTRILEIIKPDEASVEAGRSKYKAYQQLDYELTHFKV